MRNIVPLKCNSLLVALIDGTASHLACWSADITCLTRLVRAVVDTHCSSVRVSCYWCIPWLAAFFVAWCIVGA